MNPHNLIGDAEQELRTLSTELTEPGPEECLLCYVYRMLEYGCTGLRWACHYRDWRAPGASGLEDQLAQMGGYCDCEIFCNAYALAPQHVIPAQEHHEDGVTYETDPGYPDPLPPCRGVPPGSTRGCELWLPMGWGW
jgi:hypothetical protein